MFDQTLARMSELLINTGDWYTITATDTIGVPNSGNAEVAVWTKIAEITTLSPDTSKGTGDTSSYDNAGWDDHLVTNRGMTLSYGYNFITDDDDPQSVLEDAGQAALEALSLEIGQAAVGQFMWRVLNTNRVYIFNATANRSGPGGGVNDIADVTGTLEVKGVPYTGAEPELSAP